MSFTEEVYIFVNLYIRLTTSIYTNPPTTHYPLPFCSHFLFLHFLFFSPTQPYFLRPISIYHFSLTAPYFSPTSSLSMTLFSISLSNFHFAYFSPRYHAQYPLTMTPLQSSTPPNLHHTHVTNLSLPYFIFSMTSPPPLITTTRHPYHC